MKMLFFKTKFPFVWLPRFRVGTALLLGIDFMQIWPDVPLLYHAQRLAHPSLLEALDPVPGPTILQAPLRWVDALLYIYPAFCLLLGLGLLTRLSAAVLLLLHYYLFVSIPIFSYGVDLLAGSALFYCLLFPAGRYLSLDQLLFRLHPSNKDTPSLRILQLHVCIIYFFAGLGKFIGPTWHDGEALWKSLNLPDFSGLLAFLPPLLYSYPRLWTIAGWTVTLLEMGYPLFIWLKPTRRYWLWGMVGLHIAIALFMGLYFFSAIMILLNLCAFYYPYITTPANQHQISIPMVSPLSPDAQGNKNPDASSGLIQTPPNDMT